MSVFQGTEKLGCDLLRPFLDFFQWDYYETTKEGCRLWSKICEYNLNEQIYSHRKL